MIARTGDDNVWIGGEMMDTASGSSSSANGRSWLVWLAPVVVCGWFVRGGTWIFASKMFVEFAAGWGGWGVDLELAQRVGGSG
jgi:hypothetical protein